MSATPPVLMRLALLGVALAKGDELWAATRAVEAMDMPYGEHIADNVPYWIARYEEAYDGVIC